MDQMRLLPAAFLQQQQLHRHARKLLHVMATEKLVNMAMTFLMLSTGLVQLVNGNTTAVTPGSILSPLYYEGLCPGFGAFTTLKFQNLTDAVVAPRIAADPSLAPALMRLVFHDCFVEGCDASVLLNSTAGNVAERDAVPNLTLRGFEVIDAVKAALELVCPGVFSCADIVQEVVVAALKHMNQTINTPVLLRYGRRDGRVSLASEANQFIPAPNMNFTQLVASFAAKGLNTADLVHLSGAHTFGHAHCLTFIPRLYNFSGDNNSTDPALDPTFADSLKVKCPQDRPLNVVNIDVATPSTFDNQYYNNIKAGRVLFTSDNALKNASTLVSTVIDVDGASNATFLINFAIAFEKMTEISVKLYPNGEIRSNCALRK